MNKLQSVLLGLLHDKALLKQEVIGVAIEKFNLFKQVMSTEVLSLASGLKDRRIRMQFTDKGTNECQVLVGSDALIFHLHTNVFALPSDHPFWKVKYLKEDYSRGYFGVIYVYNFLAKSILQHHNGDGGDLLARIFINKDGFFFIEGVQLAAEKFPKLGRVKLGERQLEEIFHLLSISAVNFDLLVPPYETVSSINVMQLQEISSNLGMHTAKKLGFEIPNHTNLNTIEDDFE